MELVSRFAEGLLSQGRSVPPYADQAHALAWDALTDTIEGRSRWDPGEPEVPLDQRRTLERHLLDVVKRRVFAAWERARLRPHVSIDQPRITGQTSARDEMERALQAGAPDPRHALDVHGQIAELRQRAAGDPDVLALIDARVAGQTQRADALSIHGWSTQRYRAALRRFDRLAKAMRAEQDLTRNGKEPS